MFPDSRFSVSSLSRQHERLLRWAPLLLLIGFLALPLPPALAHEIPTDVRIKLYLKSESDGLMVYARVPLESMRDMSFAERGPGYLDMVRARDQLPGAVSLWLSGDLSFDVAGRRLGPPTLVDVRLALPSNSAFASFADAVGSFSEPRLADDTELYWEQALLDVALKYPGVVDDELFITPGLARLGLRTFTEVGYLADDDELRSFVFVGDPGRVSLAPGGGSVFVTFLLEGFHHVLDGIDHLLFLAALILPIRRLRPLVVIVTAFTVAHSLTLAASVFDLVPSALWFVPMVEMLVAASIVFMALENIVLPGLERRWLIAYGFGLIHGFAFSFALSSTLQLAGDHLGISLLAFNLGIEAAQLLVLVAALVVLRLVLARLPEKPTLIVLSALIAHSGWHWLTDRFAVLQQYSISLPPPGPEALALAGRWLMLVLVAVFVVWLARTLADRAGLKLGDDRRDT